MCKKSIKIIFFVICFSFSQITTLIFGDIAKNDHLELLDIRTCPDYVDSCLYVCSDGVNQLCHPEDLYAIEIDTSGNNEHTDDSRYRIYFPWQYDGMTADKFTVTASWPCLSPTAVYASGNYAYWDIYGNDDCPGTVQGSIWYGDNCQDSDGNIGSEDCKELVGRFCFVAGDTLNWSENADQSISTDVCDACWMSSPAWSYYDLGPYSDSLMSPAHCEVYDHCHHSASDSTLCGVGYLDGTDSSSISITQIKNVLEYYSLNNYPNPFNASTNISYDVPKENFINIVIYDIRGISIIEIVNRFHHAGQYTIDWNGKNKYGKSVPAGMYFSVLKASDYSLSKKLLLLK